MKGDITNDKQLTILTNLENINTLTGVIRDMVEDGLKDRRLIGYYLQQKIIPLTNMIEGYVRESLTCAEELEIQEEV
ncbi:MAG: hypothetical protein AB7C92_03000 [Synergistaceae bacterium]